MKTRAKLTVSSVSPWGDAENVKFNTVYNSADSPEDNDYSKWTPSANAELTITNPSLIGKFQAGQKYYVDFTLIE